MSSRPERTGRAPDIHCRGGSPGRCARAVCRLRRRTSRVEIGHGRPAEGAPASGAAELIVDITTTGATLAANGLKILSDGLILKSQAQLTASLKAAWSAEVNKMITAYKAPVAPEDVGTIVEYLTSLPSAK